MREIKFRAKVFPNWYKLDDKYYHIVGAYVDGQFNPSLAFYMMIRIWRYKIKGIFSK